MKGRPVIEANTGEPIHWVDLNERERRELVIQGAATILTGVVFLAVFNILALSIGLPLLFVVTSVLGAIGFIAFGILLVVFARSMLRAAARTWDGLYFDYGRSRLQVNIREIGSMSILRQSFLRRPLEIRTQDGHAVLVKGISRLLANQLILFVKTRQAEMEAQGDLPPSSPEAAVASIQAPTLPNASAPNDATRRWNAASLADGREIPDGPMVLTSSESAAAAPTGSWMSISPRRSQALAFVATGMVFIMALLFIPIPFGKNLLDGYLVALAVGSGVLGLLLYYSYYQFLGQYGFATLVLPPSSSRQPAVEALLQAACTLDGLSLPPMRKRGLWVSWSLGRYTTFRFAAPMGGIPARLVLQTYKDENAALHRRLKGSILETLGAPSPSSQVQFPTGPSRVQARVVGAPSPGQPFTRSNRPAPLSHPTSWAFSLRPGESRPVADIALPDGGADRLPPGWWASKALSPAIDRETRILIAMIGIMILVLLGLIAAGLALSGRVGFTSSFLEFLALGSLLFLAIVGGSIAFARRERREQREISPECFLRVELGGQTPSALSASIERGLRAWVPWLRPRPPSLRATAHWEDAGGTLSLTLVARQGSGDAVLQLHSNRKGNEVAIVKGAVEAALFGG